MTRTPRDRRDAIMGRLERAERAINGDTHDPESSRWTATTFIVPSMSEGEKARLEEVGRRLGAWWDSPPGTPIPEMPDAEHLDCQDVLEIYRKRWGDPGRMMMGPICDDELRLLMLKAIRTGEPIPTPTLPPGCLS